MAKDEPLTCKDHSHNLTPEHQTKALRWPCPMLLFEWFLHYVSFNRWEGDNLDSYAETELYYTFESILFFYTFLCCISVEVFLRVVYLVSGFAPRLWCNLQQTQAYKPYLKQEHILSWGSWVEELQCVNVTVAVWNLRPVLLLLERDTPLDLREVGKQKGNTSWGFREHCMDFSGIHNYLTIIPRLSRNLTKSICCQDAVGRGRKCINKPVYFCSISPSILSLESSAFIILV